MGGADSRKFKKLILGAKVIAFEGNPNNFQVMNDDADLQGLGIRVIHRLVSNQEGICTFFVQRPISATTGLNKGTSSAMRRSEQGMEAEEVCLGAV